MLNSPAVPTKAAVVGVKLCRFVFRPDSVGTHDSGANDTYPD
ncbi:hypothetical protein [Arthrobacter sp. UYCu723]